MLYHTERDCYTLLLLSQFLIFPTSNVPTVPTGWVTCPVKSPVCQEAVLKKFRCSVWLHLRGVSFAMFVDFAVVTTKSIAKNANKNEILVIYSARTFTRKAKKSLNH